MEEVTTVLTGSKMWIVVGIVCVVCLLIIAGLCLDTTRPYILDAVKILLGTIPVVSGLK